MAEIIVMPKLTATMQVGKVLKWHKQEGDFVKKGEIVLEIAADKAVMQVEAPASSYLLKSCCREGQEIPVGQPVAYLGEKGETIPEGGPVQASAGAGALPTPSQRTGIKATPVAKKMAKELEIDLNLIQGSGKDGLIVREDIEAFLSRQQEEPDDSFILLEGARQVMAEKMSLSRKTAAHATTIAEVDMKELVRQKEGFGYTAAVIWAAAKALREFPLINSSLDGNKIILHRQVHISVAVSTPKGLLVPVIKNADTKDVQEVEAEIRRLSVKARDSQLSLEDLEGGTFTVTNSGTFGSLFFMPIINHPQSAIIGMGKVMDTPVARDKQVVIHPIMYLSLSYDHRIIEGGIGVKFLQRVKGILETWQ